MKTTQHASIRSQQRGVPPLVIDLLMQLGARERQSSGSQMVYFDRDSRKRVKAYTGGLMGKLNEHLDAYVIVSDDDHIITVGTRYKRINHKTNH